MEKATLASPGSDAVNEASVAAMQRKEIRSMLAELSLRLIPRICVPLIKSLLDYHGLRHYISFLYQERLHPERITTIYAYSKNQRVPGEKIFWDKVFSRKLEEGDLVKLHNFQISSWFPRRPGLYWTRDAERARQTALRNHIETIDGQTVVFDIWGKTLMSELGGIGTVNFRKHRDDVLITATGSGVTEKGIPIICPRQIWDELHKELNTNKMIEVDLQGSVAPIPSEFESFFLRSPGIPKVAVRIKSLMNINVKDSLLDVVVTPWTLFETSDEHYPYGFTFVHHKLHSDDMSRSTNWMTDYVERKGGTQILTDFDEETNSLNAFFPLSGCIDGSVISTDILRYCQTIKKRLGNRA